jgi:hypothetical protein
MKKIIIVILFIFSAMVLNQATAQCSICTRTAQQLGEKPAKGLNAGILYLMITPFALVTYIGYRWWKDNK